MSQLTVCDGEGCEAQIKTQNGPAAESWVKITPRHMGSEPGTILSCGTLHLCKACWGRVGDTLKLEKVSR